MSRSDRSEAVSVCQPHVSVPVSECALARAIDEVGDAWTLLILRESLCGATRFDTMQEELGISRGVLAARLRLAIERDLLTRCPVKQPGRRTHYSYELTGKGRALLPALMALRAWSETYLPGTHSKLEMRTRDGQAVEVRLTTNEGREINPEEVVVSAKVDS